MKYNIMIHFRGGNGNLNGWLALASWHPLQTFQLFIVLITVCKLFEYLGWKYLFIYMCSFKDLYRSFQNLMLAKLFEIQLNRIPCWWTHVQIMHMGLLGRQNSKLMQNPLFYFGNFFFLWIWFRLSLIRFSTFQ